ncbi:iron ABC transporter substrate-binding protein [Pseudaminobacter sp. NGMCC 1.201702]|uniref:iron ABC transporter substrate-binding protein n=1 Tax=Pseudaminobacter sp. NGMCC 1.201702 TaxID=3391825 RepID=UPI0039EFE8BA
MSVTTASGAKIFIGPTTAAADAAAYAALVYTEIGEVESLGEFGDEAADVTFTSLSDARVRHLKGSRDAGVMSVVVGRDPLDLGQVAARAAEKTKFAYAFKVVAADAQDANDTDSTFYFHALVQSAKENFGESDNVVRTTFNLGITTAIIEVPATVVP